MGALLFSVEYRNCLKKIEGSRFHPQEKRVVLCPQSLVLLYSL